jgi:hypothetical protein
MSQYAISAFCYCICAVTFVECVDFNFPGVVCALSTHLVRLKMASYAETCCEIKQKEETSKPSEF